MQNEELTHTIGQFHHLGLRPDAARDPEGLLPPHLAPIRSAPTVRGAFPVCIVEGEEETTAIPITILVDDALAQLGLQDDEGAHCRKVVQQLESEMTNMANRGAEEDLSDLWGAAATLMIANPEVPEAGRERIRKDLSRVRTRIDVDGLVLPYTPSAPVQLLQYIAKRYTPEAAFVRDMTALQAQRAADTPILLHVDTETLDAADFDRLLGLLDTDMPVKVMVTIDRLYDTEDLETGRSSGWRPSLAGRAMTSGQAYVLQATATQAALLMQGFSGGLRFNGPALFCIYTGAGTQTPALRPYLAADAALPSRTFPSLIYNPANGNDGASRFQLIENPQPEQPWPQIEIPSSNGKEGKTGLFTALDFLACDNRLSSQFMAVPSSFTHDALVPLDVYLATERAVRVQEIPYILLDDESGKTHRVICTKTALNVAEAIAMRWRSLQEQAGINNPYAIRATEAENARMLKVLEQEKAALELQHQVELEQLSEKLAHQITSNIAAGLLNLTESGLDAPVPVAAPPKPEPEKPKQAEAPPPQEEPEEEDEGLSFDEPYIDTPECTSCDECINQNAAMFAYDDDDKAYIKDPRAGTYKDLVVAAENCPARIIHPGKPLNPDEPGLDELLKRAQPFL